jgi:hypothetical protein
MNLIVSMTTTPTRLPLIETVLKSIMESQTRKPDKVLVHLPDVFERTGESYSDPNVLYPLLTERYDGLLIWCRGGPDYGPVTKLQGALTYLADKETPDTPTYIVTIDDDILYLPKLLETYEKFMMMWQNASLGDSTFTPFVPCGLGFAGFNFSNPSSDSPTHMDNGHIVFEENQSFCQVLEGYLSVCYSTKLFNSETKIVSLDMSRDVYTTTSWPTYLRKCLENPDCRMSDDIIISNWLAMVNAPRLVLKQTHLHKQMFWNEECILKHGLLTDALHKQGDSAGYGNHKRYVRAKQYLCGLGWLASELGGSSHSPLRDASMK